MPDNHLGEGIYESNEPLREGSNRGSDGAHREWRAVGLEWSGVGVCHILTCSFAKGRAATINRRIRGRNRGVAAAALQARKRKHGARGRGTRCRAKAEEGAGSARSLRLRSRSLCVCVVQDYTAIRTWLTNAMGGADVSKSVRALSRGKRQRGCRPKTRLSRGRTTVADGAGSEAASCDENVNVLLSIATNWRTRGWQYVETSTSCQYLTGILKASIAL